MSIKQYNEWFDHLSTMSEADRREWVTGVIGDLKNRSKTEKNKKIADFVSLLEDKTKCKIVGFQPFIEYARVYGDREMLEPNFLHAWGGTVLVCVLKGLPAILLVGADVEWTDFEGFKG